MKTNKNTPMQNKHKTPTTLQSTLIAQATKGLMRTSPVRSIDLANTKAPKHLPPQFGKYKGRKTLVLDLDETLVHSTFQDEGHTDIDLPVALLHRSISRIKLCMFTLANGLD